MSNTVIRKTETKYLLISLFTHVTLVYIRIFFHILEERNIVSIGVGNQITSSIFILFYCILLICQIYLYSKLLSSMKNNLNFYFKHNSTNLLILMLINTSFFVVYIAYNAAISFLGVKTTDMFGYSKHDEYYDWQRAFFLVWWIFLISAEFTYIFLNIKGINFKDWMYDMMKGYRILNHYDKFSVFILRNPYYSSSEVNTSIISSSSIDSLGSYSSKSSTIILDYDTDDKYMRNYKLLFEHNSIQNSIG